MDKLLVAAGIAIIVFILWRDWVKETTLQIEKEDDRKLLGELAEARKEVQVLLEQLETASKKIVDEISFGLQEIKLQVASAVDISDNPEVSKAPAKTETPKTQKAVEAKSKSDASLVKVPHENEIPPKHQMVYAMADLGHTEEDIAKQMKIGKGEVSLLLQLRRRGEEGNV